MNWTDIFKFTTAFLASLGGGVVIVFAFSSWLGKVWAKRILNKEKHELEKLRQEHQVRFEKLHIERAEAIKEIAIKLQELDDSIYSFLKEFQPTEEPELEGKIKSSINIHEEFITLYKKHKIYFSKETEQKMHNVALCARDTYIDVTTQPINTEDIEYKLMPSLLKERDEYWQDAKKRFHNDIKKLKEELETEFRKIMGIN